MYSRSTLVQSHGYGGYPYVEVSQQPPLGNIYGGNNDPLVDPSVYYNTKKSNSPPSYFPVYMSSNVPINNGNSNSDSHAHYPHSPLPFSHTGGSNKSPTPVQIKHSPPPSPHHVCHTSIGVTSLRNVMYSQAIDNSNFPQHPSQPPLQQHHHQQQPQNHQYQQHQHPSQLPPQQSPPQQQSSPNLMTMSPNTFENHTLLNKAVIPLLNLKQSSIQNQMYNTSNTISPRFSQCVPSQSPTSTPPVSPKEQISLPSQSPSSSSFSPRSSLSDSKDDYDLSSSTTDNEDPNNSDQYIKKADQQWKKLEYYSNDLNHFVFDTIKSKQFNQINILKEKLEELSNAVKEIEITNSIFKTLPPQTRARKKRSTKAEKLKKDVLGIKRTFVTTPKCKGIFCTMCGTMETPEWRRGPNGTKSLCNACGLHYAKNIKKESINHDKMTKSLDSNTSNNVNSLKHSISSLLDN